MASQRRSELRALIERKGRVDGFVEAHGARSAPRCELSVCRASGGEHLRVEVVAREGFTEGSEVLFTLDAVEVHWCSRRRRLEGRADLLDLDWRQLEVLRKCSEVPSMSVPFGRLVFGGRLRPDREMSLDLVDEGGTLGGS